LRCKGFDEENLRKGEAPMKLEISVPEIVGIFKGIQEQPEQLYEMIRANIIPD
jgi:hypothetical protein